jgi:glycerophosphoryl diester phosphodiesterase
MKQLFLYAHRGASAEAPENTLAAFHRALAVGADGIELDVHLSRDGVPVVIHDDTLERTTDGTGRVAAQTLDRLQALDAGSWFAPHFAGEALPTLAATLHLLAGRLRLNLEVKDARAGMAVCGMLAQFPQADAVVSSFDLALLGRLRRESPALSLAVLADDGWHRAVAWAVGLRACAFHPRAELVSRLLLAVCRRLRLPVYAWTVDDPARALALARIGIDGLFTNDPGFLRQDFPRRAAPCRLRL